MGCDYQRLPHPGIQTLSPYIPGKSALELANEQGLTDIIKLASNENPLGCSHMVSRALATLSGHDIATYPAPNHSPLIQHIATNAGITSDMLTLGNGSDMLFPLIINCFALHQDKHIMVQDYAFSAYKIYSNILGVPVISTPLHDDWTVNIEAIIATCTEKTAVIFLPNPNNPTGIAIEHEQIKRLVQQIPESTILVLDEAYFEYQKTDKKNNAIGLIKKHPNLIVTRTFSKAYGLAGLRIGYAIAAPPITELLLRINPPFIVNQAGLVAAQAALEDAQFIVETLKINKQGLTQIKKGLRQLHLSWLPTAGNFITINCMRDAGPLYQSLLTDGIIVRPLHPYQMDNYLRVTIGTPQQNSRFLNAFAKCIGQD